MDITKLADEYAMRFVRSHTAYNNGKDSYVCAKEVTVYENLAILFKEFAEVVRDLDQKMSVICQECDFEYGSQRCSGCDFFGSVHQEKCTCGSKGLPGKSYGATGKQKGLD